MRPVTGVNGNSAKRSGDADGKDSKRGAERGGEVHHDIDSSEETQSDTSSEKSKKTSLKVKTKHLPKEKPVSVAPHSTTNLKPADTLSSSKPVIRSSKKRDDYQNDVKREKIIGEKGSYRRRETNLQASHPELQFIQLAKFKKDLLDRSQAAGGYLEVKVKDKKDIDILVTVLDENPSIHALKLISNFGSSHLDRLMPSIDLHLAILGVEDPTKLDEKSFRKLLRACKNIQELNLPGCGLSEQNWIDLSESFSNSPKLQRLILGGDDFLSDYAADALAQSLKSKTPSLRELCIDGLKLDAFAGMYLLQGICRHAKFKKIALHNIDGKTFPSCLNTVVELCRTNPALQYLSLGGGIFEQNQQFYKFVPQIPPRGGSIAQDQSIFKAHKSLRVLDLTGCDVPRQSMSLFVACLLDNGSLIDVRTEDATIDEDDRSKLTAMTTRNRRNLEIRAAEAFSLLIGNTPSQVDTWPSELTGVFIENAPLDALLDIAAVIDDKLDSVPAVSESSSDDSSDSSFEQSS